jgi:hypothetical protein
LVRARTLARGRTIARCGTAFDALGLSSLLNGNASALARLPPGNLAAIEDLVYQSH